MLYLLVNDEEVSCVIGGKNVVAVVVEGRTAILFVNVALVLTRAAYIKSGKDLLN